MIVNWKCKNAKSLFIKLWTDQIFTSMPYLWKSCKSLLYSLAASDNTTQLPTDKPVTDQQSKIHALCLLACAVCFINIKVCYGCYGLLFLTLCMHTFHTLPIMSCNADYCVNYVTHPLVWELNGFVLVFYQLVCPSEIVSYG